jgi:hypothetical protein
VIAPVIGGEFLGRFPGRQPNGDWAYRLSQEAVHAVPGEISIVGTVTKAGVIVPGPPE